MAREDDRGRAVSAPLARARAPCALGRRSSRASRLAVRRGHDPAAPRAADPRRSRGQSVLPRGARRHARRDRRARSRRRRLAIRPRGGDRDPADRREGDPRPDRPALRARSRRSDCGLRVGTALRAAAARGRDGRGRLAPGVAERAPARRPDPGGATVARAGVPVQARADPGGRVQDAARRGSRGAPPQGDALARGALRREPRRGPRPARVTTRSPGTPKTRRSST